MCVFFLLYFIKNFQHILAEECVINYSTPCPEGWRQININQCLSPISYTGPCDSIITIINNKNHARIVQHKKQIESKCNVNWPCSHVDNDYTKQCPDYWFLKPNKTCSPSYGYTGSCSDHYFSSIEDKMKWSNRCNLKWSKGDSTDSTIITGCPKNWDRVIDFCIAPSSYTGPCLTVAPIANKSTEFKKAYELLCNVTFN